MPISTGISRSVLCHLLQIEFIIHITRYSLIRLHNVFDLCLDEIVERVDVLLHQTLDLEKSREQIPFVLFSVKNSLQVMLRGNIPLRYL